MAVLHRLEEDVLERVSLEVQASELHASIGRDAVEVADVHAVAEHELHAPIVARKSVLAAHGRSGFRESARVAARLDLEEGAVRAALGLEVAVRRDAAVLENEDLL